MKHVWHDTKTNMDSEAASINNLEMFAERNRKVKLVSFCSWQRCVQVMLVNVLRLQMLNEIVGDEFGLLRFHPTRGGLGLTLTL